MKDRWLESRRAKGERADFLRWNILLSSHDEAPLCGSDFPDEFLRRSGREEEGHRERKGLAVAEVASGGMERRRREWAPSLNEISHSRLIREISPWNEFHDSSWWSLGGFEKMAQVWPIAQPPVYFWRNSGHLFHGRILVGHGTLPISRQSFRSNWIITKLDGYLSCTLDNCVWDLVECLGKKKYKTRDVSRCFIFLTLKL